MKNKLFQSIIDMSRRAVYIVAIQMIFTGLLLANKSNGQPGIDKSLKDIQVTISAENVTLTQAFSLLERATGFEFAYAESKIPASKRVTIKGNENLEQILNYLSKKAGVKFTRINTKILVSRIQDREKEVLELINIREKTVAGRVADSNNEPLPGASIIVKGTSIGTVTSVDGTYSLSVPDNADTLVFNYVGFLPQVILIGSKTEINVLLIPDIQMLKDVVVIGYGTQQKRDVTGAISNVSLANISSRNVNSVGDFLQGSVAGVTVQNNGGDPTALPTIRIRGMSTVNANEEPLWVVDGVPYNGSYLNPSDIESITVLKDASAAAIYGARGASGIIMITTKKGKTGKPQLSVNVYGGYQKAWKTLDPLNAAEFADIQNLAANNAGVSRNEAFDADKNPDSRITRTNWMDEIFRTGSVQNYDLSLSAGNENSRFLLSGGYRKNEGILLNTHLDRYSFRINSDHQLGQRLTIGQNLSLNYTDGNGANSTSPYTGTIITAIYYPPNATVYNQDGSGTFGGVPEKYAGAYGDVINPVAYLKRLDSKNPRTNIFGNAYAELKLINGLKYRLNIGYTLEDSKSKNFQTKVLETGKKFFDNNLFQQASTNKQLLVENTLNYQQTFGKHNLTGLIGYTYQRNKSDYFSVQGKNFDSEAVDARYLDNAQLIYKEGTYGSAWEDVLISYLGRVTYSFNDKYLFTANLRRDGSSRLAKDNRWGWSPSFTAGWRISQEDLFQKFTWLSDLKLRASWGKTGNIGVLPFYPTYVTLTRTNTILGESPVNTPGFIINSISNKELVWETSKQTDIGLDLAVLNNRLSFTVDYFNKTTKDMLMTKPITSLAGVSVAPWTNAGEVVNKGWEVSGTLKGDIKEINYSINTGVSTLKNQVNSLGGSNFLDNYPNVRAVLYPTRTQVGQSLFSFYGLKTNGIFQTDEEIESYVGPAGNKLQPYAKPGDLKFVNNNGDDQINNQDKVFLGNPFPDLTYNLNLNLNWKGLDLNVFFQGVSGVEIFNASKFTTMNASIQGYNMLSEINKAWSPTNTSSDIPRVSARDLNNNFGNVSDFYVEDGSYLRLKTLTLGYTLPNSIVGKVSATSKVRLYLTGTNLLTFTKYSGFDPEVGLDVYGVDNLRYPQSRSVIGGLNLTF